MLLLLSNGLDIDHGKSTLSDRLLELTRTIPQQPSPTASSSSSGHSNPNQLPTRNLQVLDQLAVERERGITVKAHVLHIPIGKTYLLNLIDTPGHVDFTTEVLRSLSATQGAILLVDATQGVQAQTLAVLQAARRRKLTILPVLNKLDLPSAEPEKVALQVGRLLSNDDAHNDIIKISAKTGDGVQDLLDALVQNYPRLLQILINLFALSFSILGDKINLSRPERLFKLPIVGLCIHISYQFLQQFWEIHFMQQDTNNEIEPVNQSIETRQSMVFAGLYPIDSNAFDRLADAIQRLVLNDRSVTVHKESSVALGQGFRLGFLGTLHMDVFRQRLNDEYASEGKTSMIEKPVDFPNIRNRGDGVKVFERIIDGTIIVPDRFTGPVMELCSVEYGRENLSFRVPGQQSYQGVFVNGQSHRGLQQTFDTLPRLRRRVRRMGGDVRRDERWVEIRYKIPLSEIVTTFHSTLKSLSSGYATFDYETPEGIKDSSKPISSESISSSIKVHPSTPSLPSFIAIMHLEKLKPFLLGLNPITAVRKDVTAGLYGGHYERKMKHLQKQKEGKKKLRSLSIGKVEIPQEAFSAVLSVDGKVSATVSGNKRR
ncbi:hypothetical protein H4Q26_012476 [Puccinia striiformis f. sp. tritici PST-130]|nr:hypothetical protein H4Q26_012476 [Puccinia striiformis f. sp. tritici PST-130]